MTRSESKCDDIFSQPLDEDMDTPIRLEQALKPHKTPRV